jgi:hypothetical protein
MVSIRMIRRLGVLAGVLSVHGVADPDNGMIRLLDDFDMTCEVGFDLDWSVKIENAERKMR